MSAQPTTVLDPDSFISAGTGQTGERFDVGAAREQFPILNFHAPYKFEAGTPNLVGAVGLGVAIDFLNGRGREALATYEHDLLAYGTEAFSAIPGLRLVGTAPAKQAILSFVLEGVHPHDIGTVLDREGVAIRTGHHCAQPLLNRLGLSATTRASLACYSTRAEIDALVAGLERVQEAFG